MDLFHITGLKIHKVSFDATYDSIKRSIDRLKDEYDNTWNALNETRKKWASIQESIIVIVKSHRIKFSKSLDKCSNEEMIQEIKRIIEKLPQEQEILEKYIKDLNKYYSIMTDYSNKLMKLSEKLNLMSPLEEDKDEELIIDLDAYREAKNRSMLGLEEVIATYTATDKIINSKNQILNTSTVEKVPFIEINNFLVTDPKIADAKETDELDYLEYEIKGNLTLIDIAESVYGNKSYWVFLYNYSTNKDIIDEIAEKYEVEPSVIAIIKGFLDGVKLKFPLDLFDTYRVSENVRKVA